MYSIYDSISCIYSQPFYAINDGMALRQFENAANDPESNVSKHHASFSLVLIGEFDDQNAEITDLLPKTLGVASEYRKPENINNDNADYHKLFNQFSDNLSNLAHAQTLQADVIGELQKQNSEFKELFIQQTNRLNRYNDLLEDLLK